MKELLQAVRHLTRQVEILSSRLDKYESNEVKDSATITNKADKVASSDEVPSEEKLSEYLTRNNVQTSNDYAKVQKTSLDRMLEAQLRFNADSTITTTTKTEVITSVTTSSVVRESPRFDGLKDKYKRDIESCSNPSELSTTTTSILTEVEDLMNKYKSGEEAALLSSAYDEALGTYRKRLDYFKSLRNDGTVKTVTKVSYSSAEKHPSRGQETALQGTQSPSVVSISTKASEAPRNGDTCEFLDMVIKPMEWGVI